MVRSWILKSVSPSIAQSILHVDRARDLWNELKRRFSHGDPHRISALHDEIANLRQGSSSVTDYYTSCRTLWDELETLRPLPVCVCDLKCTCGLAVVKCSCNILDKIRSERDQDQVLRFLKGLNDEYGTIKSGVLVLEPMPDVHQVFGMAIKLERQLHGLVNHTDFTQANAAVTEVMNDELVAAVSGFNQGFKNRSNNQKIRTVPKCTFCNMTGHTVDKCYKKREGKTKSSYIALKSNMKSRNF